MSETVTPSKALFDTPQGTIWYLLYCKAKEESRAVMHLANQGIEGFYPTVKMTKVLRGKRQQITEPMFPNYVFVKLDHELHNFTSVRSTRGVLGFVKQGKSYQKVPKELISVFQDMVEIEQFDSMLPKKGDSVMINSQSFNNIKAIYQEANGATRAFLLIDILNKPVTIELENTEFKLTDT